MVDLAKKNAVYADLFDLPDNVTGEILAGQLEVHPRPAPRHALAASAVGALLFSRFASRSDSDAEWWILYEPECHLGDDIVVPDIAGWRKSTMATLPETAWFDVCPDWVCEVISPATAKRDRGIKRDIYAREGVGHFWIVDPIEKLVEVFELQSLHWVLVQTAMDDQVIGLRPFESMPFELSALWV
jgi:Uma2 family endonuclease